MSAKSRAALVVCLVLLWAGWARAAPILVLGVQSDDRDDAKLGAAVTEQLERSGEKVLKRPRLSPADRRCNEQPCLEKLGRRFETNLVLFGSIKSTGDATREMHLSLFDAATLESREVADRCTDCNDERLGIILRGMTGRLVRAYRNPEPAAPTTGQVTAPPVTGQGAQTGQPDKPVGQPDKPAVTPGDPPAQPPQPSENDKLADELLNPRKPKKPARPAGASDAIPEVNDLDPQPTAGGTARPPLTGGDPPRSGLSGTRKGVAITLGIIGAASLATAIALTVKDGARTGGSCTYMGIADVYPDCVYNFTSLYGAGYAVAGAAALGVVITLWPAFTGGSKDRK